MLHIIDMDIVFILLYASYFFLYSFMCVTLSEFHIAHHIICAVIVMYDIIIYCLVMNFPLVKFIVWGV